MENKKAVKQLEKLLSLAKSGNKFTIDYFDTIYLFENSILKKETNNSLFDTYFYLNDLIELKIKELSPTPQVGQVVEFRHGERAVVLNDRLMFIDGHIPLERYNENLDCRDFPDFDIIRIYNNPIVNFKAWSLDMGNSDLHNSLKLVWERTE